MFDLLPETRTLAVICAFSCYDAPTETTPSCKQLLALDRVEPTVQRLVELFSTEQSKKAKMQTVVLLNQDDVSLLSSLKEIRNSLRERSDVNMLLFWSGHGNVPEGSFRMATRNTFDPIDYEDGIGLEEVMRQSGVARVKTWTLFLDACYAGEGLADVVKATQDLLKRENGQLRGYGALCSCSPYEKARDSVFLGTVVRVLENGPSEAAKAFSDQEGGGGSFNPFNRLLSIGELFEAVAYEYRADPAKFRGAKPWPITGGELSPRLFPNPQFRANQPSRLVEAAYRSFARASDLESHFFPKALGIESLESGWHFTGRVEATRSILRWMSTPPIKPEDRLYVLAADGGTGKSALLGRLIALTERNYRAQAKKQGWNETEDAKAGTVPVVDRIDVALSVRNLTPQTVAEHLANLLDLRSNGSIEEIVKEVANTYKRSDSAAPCLVLDALDEATEPLPIVFRIIRPLVEAGWKLLVATRRSASTKGAADLISDLGPSTLFELDQDQQSWNDIYLYARGRLQPEARLTEVAEPAARLIADRSENKFLFARIATSSILRRTEVISLEQLPSLVAKDATEALKSEVEALDQAFRLQFSIDANGATAMFAALAWADGEGAPMRDGIWACMAGAVGSIKGAPLRFENHHIDWLLREGGRFIQESGDGEQAVYRLFHKSLVDHFLNSPLPEEPLRESLEERIAMALVTQVRGSRDWAYINPYLVRHMPALLASRRMQKGLNELLLTIEWIQARIDLSGIQALLEDYRLCKSPYPATEILFNTLKRIAHVLHDHPDQLLPQLLGRIPQRAKDTSYLLKTHPGTNFELPPWGLVAGEESQSQKLPSKGLNRKPHIERPAFRPTSLDPFVNQAKTLICTPCWVPAIHGPTQGWPFVSTLRGHTGCVNGVALSADGRVLASASHDRTVRLWEAWTGRPLHSLQGHESWVSCVALSADAHTLVSASIDSTVRIWDAQTGDFIRTLKGHKGWVICVALSADGRTLASAGADGTVCFWSVLVGQLLHTVQCHDARINCLALSADGQTLATASQDCTVRIWDSHSGQLQHTLRAHNSSVNSVALSADGRTLASASQDGTVRIWDSHSRKLQHSLQAHRGCVDSVALSADGRTLASAGRDRNLRFWDVLSGICTQTFTLDEYASALASAYQESPPSLVAAIGNTIARFERLPSS